MERSNTLVKTLLVIAIIGAVNWGLVGIFNWNLVDAIFAGRGAADASGFSRVIYTLVGIAGLVALFLLPRIHTGPPETQTRPRT